jgi:hypothetical protein
MKKSISIRPFIRSILLLIGIQLLLLPGRASAWTPWGSGQSKGTDLQIKLVTFGPGDDIPSYWGHSALIVEDTLLKQSRIYNYGLFSFGNGMLVHFLMGRLYFSGGDFNVNSYLRFYKKQNRDVRILPLNLSARQKKELAAALAKSVLPKYRTYLYHHYRDNCSTRIRDYLDRALKGQIKQATSAPGSMTLRQHTLRYIERDPLLELGLMFLMNKDIDRPIRQWDEMFLPDELEKYIKKTVITDSLGNRYALAGKEEIYFKAERTPTPARPAGHALWFLLSGLAIGGFIVFSGFIMRNNPLGWGGTLFGALQALLGILLGIPGIILFVLATFTEHDVTYYNINLFFAHPLFLFLIGWGAALAYGKLDRFRKLYLFWLIQLGLTLIGLAVKLLPGTGQDNKIVLSLLLPIIVSAAGISIYLNKKDIFKDYLSKIKKSAPDKN